MRKWLILISLWALGASGAPVWTWVDAAGTVHYSDRPVPGARQIDLPEARGAAPAAPQAAVPAPQAQPPSTTPGAEYRTFVIASPQHQETLWNIEAVLNVELTLDPPLQAEHRVDVIFDGERQNLNVASLQFSVPNVFRGTHTLQAAIIDANDQVVLRSLPVTIMVQQTSILNPNNPNAPRRPVPNAG